MFRRCHVTEFCVLLLEILIVLNPREDEELKIANFILLTFLPTNPISRVIQDTIVLIYEETNISTDLNINYM